MFIVSRKKDESIVLDDRIILTIVDIRGDKVRIGIEAPMEVLVARKEIYEALHACSAGTPRPAAPPTPHLAERVTLYLDVRLPEGPGRDEIIKALAGLVEDCEQAGISASERDRLARALDEASEPAR